MYWPISPAKAHHQNLPIGVDLRSHDGLDLSRKARVQARDAERGQTARVLQSGPDLTDPTRPKTLKNEATANGSNETTKRMEEGEDDGSIISLCVSRHGHIFATITRTTLTVWLTKPTVVLASVIRSSRSLQTYGPNVGLLLRPDSDVLVIHSSLGYLITYSLAAEPDGRAYSLLFADGGKHARRRSSTASAHRYGTGHKGSLLDGGGEVKEARLHFRMVIRLDARISTALALDHELVVITIDPPAVQLIRWAPDRSGAQFSTELLSNMKWLEGNKTLSDVIYDRPMNLFAFVSAGGRAYAVQRLSDKRKDNRDGNALFDGHTFHTPKDDSDIAVKAAINPRFSLIAVGCTDSSVYIYAVHNYSGGIRFLKQLGLSVSASSSGAMTTLSYSPDGYCLFAGFENGWSTWSVHGQPGGSSFGCETSLSQQSDDTWLTSIRSAAWVGGGSELLLLTPNSDVIWSLEFARNAMTGCFTPANASKGLLQTSTGLIVYQGEQMPDLMTITADASLWQDIEIPSHYLNDQWPIRASVISPDRRYIAIACQRGLAHYSLQSGRWRTFSDLTEQNDFAVRGGMCWHHHVLVAAVETSAGAHELRLYSRESALENARVLHTVSLDAPVVNLSSSGDDGILVYTYENILDHYIIDITEKSTKLIKVGQIALQGIIRAPARVRAVSWIVPDLQLQIGETSQDVASASVLFLVDGSLVMLQPSTTDGGELKYDMRVIAQQVEYFSLARDDPAIYSTLANGKTEDTNLDSRYSLEDSLWVFDGQNMKVWPDVHDLLGLTTAEPGALSEACITIALDFYPFSVPLHKGIIVGAEAELTQRRDVNFAYFRTVARTTLFLPDILRYHLTYYGIPSALRLSAQFESLPYLSHALEILLHTVLDEEAERPTAPQAKIDSSSDTHDPPSLLPTILSFLSTYPDHLDIILQCTRKTELRSWRTLFAHLPPPNDLFESALQAGNLKTAGGYLLILQQHQDTPDSNAQVVPQAMRLLRRAQHATDWELCKELARFLMALDESGQTLRVALEMVEDGAVGPTGDDVNSVPGLMSLGGRPED